MDDISSFKQELLELYDDGMPVTSKGFQRRIKKFVELVQIEFSTMDKDKYFTEVMANTNCFHNIIRQLVWSLCDNNGIIVGTNKEIEDITNVRLNTLRKFLSEIAIGKIIGYDYIDEIKLGTTNSFLRLIYINPMMIEKWKKIN